MNRIEITEEMKDKANFVYRNHHARMNAISSINFEVFKQVNGRYPEVYEIWDFDKEIVEQAKQIEQKLFDEYLGR